LSFGIDPYKNINVTYFDKCFHRFVKTYSNQSTAIIMVTSSAGRPTVSSTMTMVTRPACGIPAAPIEAAVAVTLFSNNIKVNKIKGKFRA
jgi:hypothetical protein